jgi:hypothetical protein
VGLLTGRKEEGLALPLALARITNLDSRGGLGSEYSTISGLKMKRHCWFQE